MLTNPSDIRAEIARQRVLIYELAAEVGVHPARLGAMLNERRAMPPDVAARVSEALTRTAQSERSAS